MATIGSLAINLGLNTAEFAEGVKRARSATKRFERSVKKSFRSARRSVNRFGSSLFGLKGAIIAVAGPAALGLLVKSSMSAVDALAKTADKLGVTTEALAGLQHAGELTGVSTNTMNMALQRMSRRVAEAAMGTGEAQGALKELGLDAKTLSELPLDQQFAEISKAMQAVQGDADKVRLSFKLFDSEGVALKNTLALGADGLREAAREAEILGLAVNRVDAKQIENANDAFTRAKGVISGVGNTIATTLAPFLEAIANKFTNAAIEANGFKENISSGMQVVINSVGFVMDAFHGLDVVWQMLKVGFLVLVDGVVGGLNTISQSLGSIASMIPGVEVSPDPVLQEWANSASSALAGAVDKFHELTSMPMPSDNIKQWATEVTETARMVAQEQTKAVVGDPDAIAAWMARREEMEKEHQDKLASIKERAIQKQQMMDTQARTATMRATSEIFTALGSMGETESKKEFERQKKFNIAAAVVNTAGAVMNALATSPTIFVGFAMAAAALATGIAQVNRIKSQSWGGGGSVGGSPTTPAVPSSAVASGISETSPNFQQDQGTQGTVQIILQGNVMTDDFVNDSVIPVIQQAVNDRDVVLVGSGSRNAQELVPA